MELENLLKKNVLPLLGLSTTQDFACPKEGRIAHNLIVDTPEQGEVLMRCYPVQSTKSALGYGVQRARFEVEVLEFLSSGEAPVPSPLTFEDGKKFYQDNDWFIFAYNIQEGQTLSIEDLTIEIAQDAGHLLQQIIENSATYKPNGTEPDGDINYIRTILSNFIKRRPEYSEHSVFTDMFNHLSDPAFLAELDSTPKGLVHGDYFFENVLMKDGRLVGVIDFGDAYYGTLLSDIVIGAMEFSTKVEEEWDMNFFEAFIRENKGWLLENNISYPLFQNLLLANCVRFTAHISNLEQDELESNKTPANEIDIDGNPYVARYYKFKSGDFNSQLQKSYKLALS